MAQYITTLSLRLSQTGWQAFSRWLDLIVSLVIFWQHIQPR